MSTMTAAARRVIESQGFRPVFEAVGVPGSAKSRNGEIQAAHWRTTGHEVVVEDDIERDGMKGVRVWARKV